MAVPNGMSVATLQMEGEIQFSRRVLMCVCVCDMVQVVGDWANRCDVSSWRLLQRTKTK